MQIRDESLSDHRAIESLLQLAFVEDGESRLVTGLRANARPLISLVADQDGKIVGHILFSPVILDSDPTLRMMGLAPMAVLPDYQGQGVGTALIEAGLDRCRAAQIGAVVVLGHPDYYPRFGFQQSTKFDIDSEYDVPAEAFMLMEIQPGFLNGCSGTVEYHQEFKKL